MIQCTASTPGPVLSTAASPHPIAIEPVPGALHSMQELSRSIPSRYLPLENILFSCSGSLSHCFSLLPQPSSSPQAPQPSPLTSAAKRSATSSIEYWDASLAHSPEFASAIGDKRYNDKLSDYSVKAFNDWLATEQDYSDAAGRHRSHGFTEQEKTSRELAAPRPDDDQEGCRIQRMGDAGQPDGRHLLRLSAPRRRSSASPR